MAFAMMGGIIVGTLLTLLFLPALYVAWFRIKAPAAAKTQPVPAEPAPERRGAAGGGGSGSGASIE